MSGEIATIEQARKSLRSFVNKHTAQFITFVGKVSAVDENAGTCDVLPVDGNPEFFDVRLAPSVDNIVDGVIAIPVIGSYVICGRLQNENDVFIVVPGEISKYIIKCTGAGKIELNGNSFSLVKGETLQTQITQLAADLNALILLYNSHTHVIPSGTTAVTTMISNISSTDFSQILNESVKHG